MKKILAVLALGLMLSSEAHAQVAVVPPPVVVDVCATMVCKGTPVLGMVAAGAAVAFGTFVIYADATGIPFPLCGVNNWKCYQEYPHGHNGRLDD